MVDNWGVVVLSLYLCMHPLNTATPSPETKDEFYVESTRLVHRVHSTDVVIAAIDFNTQLGYLAEAEWHIGGRFSVPADRTDNKDCLTQVFSEHRRIQILAIKSDIGSFGAPFAFTAQESD